MLISAFLVTLYYAAVPLTVVGISWIIIRRDYGDRGTVRKPDSDARAGTR